MDGAKAPSYYPMINIFTVISEMEKENWTLISQEYKNLKEPLEMKCPNGHKQEQSFEKWRRNKRCEACLKDSSYRIKQNHIPPKKIEVNRTLALDAATNLTGFAIYDDEKLVGYGTLKAKSSTDPTARINEIKHLVMAGIDEWAPDFIGMEHIQLQTYGPNDLMRVETFRVLANLQGVLCDVFFEKGIPYQLTRSSQWRSYCGIVSQRRDAQKKEAQAKVKLWYGIDCTDDEADAICLGKYCVRPTRANAKMTYWGEDL